MDATTGAIQRCSHCKIAVRMLSLKRGKTFGDVMGQIADQWNRRAT